MATIKAYILRTSKKNTKSNIHLRLNGGRGIDISSVIPKTVLLWRHNLLLISKVKEDNQAEFYANESITKGWTRD